MSTSVPNPTTRAQLAVPYRASPILHPDYIYWSGEWEKIRDAEVGEIEVKRKREKYLPKMATHDKNQYEAYLHRAVFFNMTSRTLNALYGTVFRRAPKVTGLTPTLTEKVKKLTKEGMSLHLMTKTSVKEVLAVGRYGMLVDANPDGAGDAYVACYTAENILDWEMAEINGRWQLAKVTLREIYYDRDGHWSPYEHKSRFRILMLNDVDGEITYEQFIYEDIDAHNIPDIDQMPDRIVTPEVRGQVLDYIPFIVIGPFTNYPDVQKPPMLDIVTLNYSHYMSYAQLEHGRFYTGNPVYYAQNDSAVTPGDYHVGPDVVWILDKGEQAGIIEFNGAGLRFLENALSSKEAQIASLGGRMMPGSSRGAAESDNSLLMQERNEQTLLLNLADTTDEGVTQILRWWADWNNVNPSVVSKITFELNRDFLIKDAGAREFRAIHQMYADGVIPVEVVYDYLKRFEVIPEWMEREEYLGLLEDSKQFPNMVDVLAKMQSFPDAKSMLEYKVMQETAQAVKPTTNEPAQPGVPKQARAAQQVDNPPKKEEEDEEEQGSSDE
jgi:hypothetical protein